VNSHPFVFLDPSGKRWPRLRLLGRALGALCLVGVGIFAYTLVTDPPLPARVRDLKRKIRAEQHANPLAQFNASQTSWIKFYEANRAKLDQLAAAQRKTRRAIAKDEIRAGFFVGWDEESFRSLTRHAGQLTHVCPEMMRLVNVEGKLEVEPNERLQRFAQLSGLKIVPVLSNTSDAGWEPEAAEYLAFGPEAHRAEFIRTLRAKLAEMNAAGVLLDFEQMDPSYQPQITKLFAEIAQGLHADGRELWLTVPMGDDINEFDLETLSGVVDHFVAELHDENGDDDEPGPIASQDWFDGWLNLVSTYGDSSQWIIDIGAYGYDWAKGQPMAQTISFADAMSRARYAEPDDVAVDAPTFNPTFSYTDSGIEHTVWFLDAATFLNQWREARDAGAGGFMLTRLGAEDPQLWDALKLAPEDKPAPAELAPLAAMPSGPVITNLGSGDVVSIEDEQEPGKREVSLRADGRFEEHYVDYPVYPTLYHKGAGGGHRFALTFDDGPDPTWTPRILDILKQHGAKATFFLIGQNAEENPALVRRILAEGHAIGSHTYTHPNLGLASPQQVKLELNATQRLFESITGRSTTLFRPPYDADSTPTDIAQIAPLEIADRMNYTTVLESIDPEDWDRPGAKEIVRRVKAGLDGGGTNILLHDGGGDREQTVKALPKILDAISARGDRVVPLRELLGTTDEDLMPPVSGSQFSFDRLASAMGFHTLYFLQQVCWAFVLLAMALVLARTAVVLALAFLHWRQGRRWRIVENFKPPLSVLVPAYNEGKVIAATLRSVLATRYESPIEVIVVDDGSTDDTYAAAEAVAKADPRVRLFSQLNQGKAAALQRALSEAANDIVVFIDADTRIARDAFTKLVQPLAEARVGAVSGHARVGNRRSFLARCQDLEYICGFNLDRRAYSLWNCITVAPGAISAFRKSAIADAGGFSRDTLAEDTDLTLAVHRAGYRVDYAPDAVAWTEAPESVRALAKQRFRWAFGTLQSIWKHRDLTFSRRAPGLGWFSLPSVWFFQLALVAAAPLIDLAFLYAVVVERQIAVLPYFLAFIGADLVLALAACVMERESWRAALRIIPMRFLYRPLLSYVVWKAILRALKGAWVGWGKLDRTASVAEVTR
jgi:cellulose synthase/poly-beta-1,6-N-acetylglucosamine synthase-like glycosyltransferase/peptidoglycan/xylan/chitin deacetylase (PgdA/CDA1 family)/spore germination protein YaaH